MTQLPEGTDPTSGLDWLGHLQALGWVDRTALGVLLVFFVIGLFKGLIWQVSRIGILVVSYFAANRWGDSVAGWMAPTPTAAEIAANDAVGAPAAAPGETTLYLAYLALFLATLVVLSLLSMLLKRLADKAGLGFFDRLGGGVVGIATGACVVLALVFVLHMFFRGSKIAEAAEQSWSLRFSKDAIDWLGSAVHDDLRVAIRLQPLLPGAGGQGTDGDSRGNTGSDGKTLAPGAVGLPPEPAPPGPDVPTSPSLPPADVGRGTRGGG